MTPEVAKRGKRGKRRGYTVMEVMMSLAILGLGAGGVIAMQKATLIANTNGRNMSAASNIAAAWAERLRSEAYTWNAPGNVPDLGTDTQWLKMAAPSGTADWFSPIEVQPQNPTPSGSPAADVLGADIYSGGQAATAFCTLLRLTSFPNAPKLIRADIFVYWERSRRPADCTLTYLQVHQDPGRYGEVHITTALVQNSMP